MLMTLREAHKESGDEHSLKNTDEIDISYQHWVFINTSQVIL